MRVPLVACALLFVLLAATLPVEARDPTALGPCHPRDPVSGFWCEVSAAGCTVRHDEVDTSERTHITCTFAPDRGCFVTVEWERFDPDSVTVTGPYCPW